MSVKRREGAEEQEEEEEAGAAGFANKVSIYFCMCSCVFLYSLVCVCVFVLRILRIYERVKKRSCNYLAKTRIRIHISPPLPFRLRYVYLSHFILSCDI